MLLAARGFQHRHFVCLFYETFKKSLVFRARLVVGPFLTMIKGLNCLFRTCRTTSMYKSIIRDIVWDAGIGIHCRLFAWVTGADQDCIICITWYATSICLLKVNNRNTRARCEKCSKLTITTPERRHWCLYFTPCSSASIVIFEHVIPAGYTIFKKKIVIFIPPWKKNYSKFLYNDWSTVCVNFFIFSTIKSSVRKLPLRVLSTHKIPKYAIRLASELLSGISTRGCQGH